MGPLAASNDPPGCQAGQLVRRETVPGRDHHASREFDDTQFRFAVRADCVHTATKFAPSAQRLQPGAMSSCMVPETLPEGECNGFQLLVSA